MARGYVSWMVIDEEDITHLTPILSILASKFLLFFIMQRRWIIRKIYFMIYLNIKDLSPWSVLSKINLTRIKRICLGRLF